MNRSKKPYVPQTLPEIWDMLGSMMISAPKFLDRTGYFPDRNIDTEFHSLNEGLKVVRNKVGDEYFEKLTALSNRMRAHFEADPEDKTEDGVKGRECIQEMEEILKAVQSKAR